MFVVMCIVVSLNPTRDNLLFAGALILFLIVTVICTFYGNLIAAYPYAVTLEVGKGLQLYAPLKRVYIPTNDLRDVQRSALQSGYVVRLNRRHRLLTGFLVPAFFGDQAEPLAEAIRTEIEENRS